MEPNRFYDMLNNSTDNLGVKPMNLFEDSSNEIESVELEEPIFIEDTEDLIIIEDSDIAEDLMIIDDTSGPVFIEETALVNEVKEPVTELKETLNEEDSSSKFVFEQVNIITKDLDNIHDKSIKDAGIELDNLTLLEKDFLVFMKDNDFDIHGGENFLRDTMNINFPDYNFDNNDEAAMFYLKLRYNVILPSIDSYRKYVRDSDLDFIQLLGSHYRKLEEIEIILLLEYYKETWFDYNLWKKYSLESKDTKVILLLMRQGLFTPEILIKYMESLDIYYASLILCSRDKFIQSQFDDVIRNRADIVEYVNACLSDNNVDVMELISKREDFTKISVSIRKSRELGKEISIDFISKYKDYYYLSEIIIAYSKGCHNDDFVEMYLKEFNSDTQFIVNHYGTPELDNKYLLMFESNYYLSKLYHDVEHLKLNTSWIAEIFSENNNYEKDYVILAALIRSHYSNIGLSKSDYRQFLGIISNHPETNCLELLKEYNGVPASFNSFWFEYLISKLGVVFDINPNIGRFIFVSTHNKNEQRTIDEFIFNQEGFSLEADSIGSVELALGNLGLVFKMDTTPSTIYKPIVKSDNDAFTSLQNWSLKYSALDYVECLYKFNYSYLLVKVKNLGLTPSPSLNHFMELNYREYMKIDRMFSYICYIKEDLLYGMDNSLSTLVIIISRVCASVRNNSKFLIYFIQRLFRYLYKDRFTFNLDTVEELDSSNAFIYVKGINIMTKVDLINFVSKLELVNEECNSAKRIDLKIIGGVGYLTLLK